MGVTDLCGDTITGFEAGAAVLLFKKVKSI
jgi:hypothetical protein